MHSFFCPLYHILFSCNLQYSRRHLPVKNTRPKWQRKNARMPDRIRYAGVYCAVTVLPHREVRCGSDFFQAAPHNSARSLRQDFCPNSKFGKRRNTVCTRKGYAASVSQLAPATAAQYFPILIPKSGQKRSAHSRGRFIQRFPDYTVILLEERNYAIPPCC